MKLALKTKPDAGWTQQLFFWITKWRLLTDYPHAGIVVSDMLLHTNLPKGLHAVAFNSDGWVTIEIPDRHDAIALFSHHRGTPYDWFSLLAFILPWQIRDSSRMYCYEWCALAMTGQMPRGRVTPEMLLRLAGQMSSGDLRP